MSDNPLADAVKQWISITCDLSDEALDSEWAWRAHTDEGVRFAFFRTYEDLRTLAASTWAERCAKGPALTTAHRALAHYHVAWRELESVLAGVGDDVLDRVPREEEWPLRRVLGHMFVVPRMFFTQTVHGLSERRAGKHISATFRDDQVETFLGHTWDQYDAMMGGSLADILADYARMHSRILTELAGISEEELSAPTLWWEEYEVPVQFRLHRFDAHMRQHTIQAEKTLDWLGMPVTEAKRLNRLIYRALADCEGVQIGAPGFAAEAHQRIAEQITARTGEIAGVVA